MISEPQTASLFAREQFRMTRLQVYNWGTFSGLHDVPISERGFLFVGRSGAGKSTLLDAFSALLTPPRWIDFNAAAREADRSGRDRNLVTSIRGAWAEQKDGESGEIATRYLRAGTTWSALALTYQNAFSGTVRCRPGQQERSGRSCRLFRNGVDWMVRHRSVESRFSIDRTGAIAWHFMGLVPALLDCGEIVDNGFCQHPLAGSHAGCEPNGERGGWNDHRRRRF